MPGKNRAKARSARTRDALTECSAAFNGIHDDLVWAIAHTASGPDRDKLERLLEPLQALLDRYPTSPATAAGEAKATPAAETPVPDVKDASGSKIP